MEAFPQNSSGDSKPHGFGSFFGSRSATWHASATTSAELALQAAELAPADFREKDVGEKPSKVHP
jgi:hypothetical protein